MESQVDTLVRYGVAFQTKCVVALLSDRSFVEQSYDVVMPEFFESQANQWMVKKIFWYFHQYKALPTIEVLKREYDKIPESHAVERVAVLEQLKNIFHVQRSNPDDLKYIKDEFLTFCKNQALKAAIMRSADLLQTANYDQIKVLIDKALHAGAERNLGHNYIEDFSVRANKVTRNIVPTPWECVNQIMDGGLGAGEIGTIVAPSGIGKSWILAALGAHAMKLGKRVAHYTFELSENYLGLRYDTIFTGIEPNLISDHQDAVQRMIAEVQGQLFIKYFPTRSITINAIMAHIQRLITLGHPPGLVIIDYADLMRSADKAEARHEELGFIHEEIRGMLGELRIPGWTASQSQRSSLQDDVVEADKIAGSYAKIMANDFVLSASRKVGDKLTNTARFHVIKNRFGPDGLTFPAEMDLSKGIINIYDESSPEGARVKAKIQSGDGALKKLLSQKFIEISKQSSQ